MGSKPDKKQIKSNIKQTQQIDRRLKAALDGGREELAQLRRAADQFLNARIQASLEAMDVEMLTQGKQKIRVSYLRSAGVQNMWQLSKLSRQQIEALDGIGAQGATIIYDLTKQIVKNTKEKLSVRIQSDSPTKADDALVAALILMIGVELGKSSVAKIVAPGAVDFTWLTMGILPCSLAVKLWMYLFYRKLGKQIDSMALRAAAVDSRNDVIASGGVLIGCLVQWRFGIHLDGYVGVAVALFILWSGISVAKDAVDPLLGLRADGELVDKISSLVLSYEKVLGIHDLLVHDYGPGQCFASVHVELSACEEPLVCHDIIDAIECDVLEQLNVHLVIHYDPVLDDDEEWAQMRCMLEKIVEEIDPRLSLHDFRIARGSSQEKLVFDLAVPYKMKDQHKQLKKQIDDALMRQNYAYTTVIRFDDKA